MSGNKMINPLTAWWSYIRRVAKFRIQAYPIMLSIILKDY